MLLTRRSVPNDNSCLFYCFGYLCAQKEASPAVESSLRSVVADAVLADEDPATRAVFLEMEVAEYADWIKNTFHWGGENEILTLASHFNVSVMVISCESLTTLTYGEGNSGGRIHILYTGQHYDPLVQADGPLEIRIFSDQLLSPDIEAAAIEIAKAHNETRAKEAAQKKVKRIKCGGCGAILDDSAAFQEHCGAIEHDDDFAYDCEEIEVVFEAGEELPEGTVDLTDEANVHTFYNAVGEFLSNFYPSPITMKGVEYPSGEHCWQAQKYLETFPELAAKIAAAATVDEAHTVSHMEGIDRHRKDWENIKYEILEDIIRAKFTQNRQLVPRLLETAGKMIVNADTDEWAGMSAASGIAKGYNNVGQALMAVRDEVAAAAAAEEDGGP
jgi:ribA/ribD-fused uncharacterized protein